MQSESKLTVTINGFLRFFIGLFTLIFGVVVIGYTIVYDLIRNKILKRPAKQNCPKITLAEPNQHIGSNKNKSAEVVSTE